MIWSNVYISTSQWNGSGTTLSVPAHFSTDLLMVMLMSNDGTPPALPAGWTNVAVSETFANAARAWRLISMVDSANTLTSVPTAWANNITVSVLRGVAVGAIGQRTQESVTSPYALPAPALLNPSDNLVISFFNSANLFATALPAICGATMGPNGIGQGSRSYGMFLSLGSVASISGQAFTWTGGSTRSFDSFVVELVPAGFQPPVFFPGASSFPMPGGLLTV